MLIVMGFLLSEDYFWSLFKNSVCAPVFPALQCSGALLFLYIISVVTDDKAYIDELLQKHSKIKLAICILLDKYYTFIRYVQAKFIENSFGIVSPNADTQEPNYIMKTLFLIFGITICLVILIIIMKCAFKLNEDTVDIIFYTMRFVINMTSVAFVIFKTVNQILHH